MKTDEISKIENANTTTQIFNFRLPHSSIFIGGSRGGRARRAPPHLPGILVFDDILGHIALADLGGRARRAPPHLPGILVFDDILGHIV